MFEKLKRLARLAASPLRRHKWIVVGALCLRGGTLWTQLRCDRCADHAAYPTADVARFIAIERGAIFANPVGYALVVKFMADIDTAMKADKRTGQS